MSPVTLTLVSWAAMAAGAWAAVEAEASGSTLLLSIAALCGLVFGLGQSLAFSIQVGRDMDAVLAALRATARPANDDGAL